MPVPWLRLIDAAFGLADIATRAKRGSAPRPEPAQDQLSATTPITGALEARLTGVVVAALKEAFNRDHERLELEREQMASERQRAERALRLELVRQAGEREIGRLRLLAGVGVACFLGTLFFSTRLTGGPAEVRVALAIGWILLLASLAAAFSGQSQIGRRLDRLAELSAPSEPPSAGAAGAAAPWLLVAGLALVGLSVIMI
jgi:hypothetical protein